MLIRGDTRVVGVFADPVEHTLSPIMQNRAFAAMGLPYVYVPWHVKAVHLPTAVAAIRALSLAGVNVTIPHKVAVMDFLDQVTPEAQLIGAVNTIENRAGTLIGHNTDAPGFLRALQEETGLSPAKRNIMILGAGGAARAIGVQMVQSGARTLVIANRTAVKGQALANFLARVPGSATTAAVALDVTATEFRQALAHTDVLINTTAAGMYPHHLEPSIVPGALLHPGMLVCDIVYTPRRTALLAAAEAAGCQTVPGLGMLAHQGAIAIEIWTGRQAPAQLMQSVLAEALEERESKGE